jgi:hypothetical protein
MQKLDFYKEMYFKEHDLKHKLDDKVPVQIGILTLIVSVNTYILKSDLSGNLLVIIKYNMLFVGGGIVMALFFMGQSFLNLGRTHAYRELASMNEMRQYDTELKQVKQENEYEAYLEKEFADCATLNRKTNIWRTEKLAVCKQFVFLAFLVSFLNAVLYIIGQFIIVK